MPAIARSARRHRPAFYWHLGDFRRMSVADEDFRPEATGQPISLKEYQAEAWQDFVEQQLKPFGDLPLYLVIGNHELKVKTRADYLATFGRWLDREEAVRATYFQWKRGSVAFIALDNATHEQFDSTQLAWALQTISADAKDPAVRSIVVGMHAALPDSISFGHSMSEGDHPGAVDSGRRVYRALLQARDVGGKNVYVLASHSHFFMEGTFNTPYWKAHGGVLPGWIIGTAGAIRYPLPPEAKDAIQAETHVYGYLLASVAADGKVDFKFQRLEKKDLAAAAKKRYRPEVIDYCFDQNSATQPVGVTDDHVPRATIIPR